MISCSFSLTTEEKLSKNQYWKLPPGIWLKHCLQWAKNSIFWMWIMLKKPFFSTVSVLCFLNWSYAVPSGQRGKKKNKTLPFSWKPAAHYLQVNYLIGKKGCKTDIHHNCSYTTLPKKVISFLWGTFAFSDPLFRLQGSLCIPSLFHRM